MFSTRLAAMAAQTAAAPPPTQALSVAEAPSAVRILTSRLTSRQNNPTNKICGTNRDLIQMNTAQTQLTVNSCKRRQKLLPANKWIRVSPRVGRRKRNLWSSCMRHREMKTPLKMSLMLSTARTSRRSGRSRLACLASA